MRCLYCGKELALFKRLTGVEFCSDTHRQQYQDEYNQLALSRLLQAKPKEEMKQPLAASDEVAEEATQSEHELQLARLRESAQLRVASEKAAGKAAEKAAEKPSRTQRPAKTTPSATPVAPAAPTAGPVEVSESLAQKAKKRSVYSQEIAERFTERLPPLPEPAPDESLMDRLSMLESRLNDTGASPAPGNGSGGNGSGGNGSNALAAPPLRSYPDQSAWAGTPEVDAEGLQAALDSALGASPSAAAPASEIDSSTIDARNGSIPAKAAPAARRKPGSIGRFAAPPLVEKLLPNPPRMLGPKPAAIRKGADQDSLLASVPVFPDHTLDQRSDENTDHATAATGNLLALASAVHMDIGPGAWVQHHGRVRIEAREFAVSQGSKPRGRFAVDPGTNYEEILEQALAAERDPSDLSSVPCAEAVIWPLDSEAIMAVDAVTAEDAQRATSAGLARMVVPLTDFLAKVPPRLPLGLQVKRTTRQLVQPLETLKQTIEAQDQQVLETASTSAGAQNIGVLTAPASLTQDPDWTSAWLGTEIIALTRTNWQPLQDNLPMQLGYAALEPALEPKADSVSAHLKAAWEADTAPLDWQGHAAERAPAELAITQPAFSQRGERVPLSILAHGNTAYAPNPVVAPARQECQEPFDAALRMESGTLEGWAESFRTTLAAPAVIAPAAVDAPQQVDVVGSPASPARFLWIRPEYDFRLIGPDAIHGHVLGWIPGIGQELTTTGFEGKGLKLAAPEVRPADPSAAGQEEPLLEPLPITPLGFSSAASSASSATSSDNKADAAEANTAKTDAAQPEAAREVQPEVVGNAAGITNSAGSPAGNAVGGSAHPDYGQAPLVRIEISLEPMYGGVVVRNAEGSNARVESRVVQRPRRVAPPASGNEAPPAAEVRGTGEHDEFEGHELDATDAVQYAETPQAYAPQPTSARPYPPQRTSNPNLLTAATPKGRGRFSAAEARTASYAKRLGGPAQEWTGTEVPPSDPAYAAGPATEKIADAAAAADAVNRAYEQEFGPAAIADPGESVMIPLSASSADEQTADQPVSDEHAASTEAIEQAVSEPVAAAAAEQSGAGEPDIIADPSPLPVTTPMPVMLQSVTAGKTKPVQVFVTALTSEFKAQVPPAEALPLRSVMLLGPMDQAISPEEAKGIAERPTGGRRPDVLISEPKPLESRKNGSKNSKDEANGLVLPKFAPLPGDDGLHAVAITERVSPAAAVAERNQAEAGGLNGFETNGSDRSGLNGGEKNGAEKNGSAGKPSRLPPKPNPIPPPQSTPYTGTDLGLPSLDLPEPGLTSIVKKVRKLFK
jgi:hypothetical protein